MTLRRRPLPSLVLCLALGGATACGSATENATTTPRRDGGPIADADAALDASDASDTSDASEAPIVQKEFPLATPSLGGYTLVDAFPALVFDIPAAIAWPKGQTTAFVLERRRRGRHGVPPEVRRRYGPPALRLRLVQRLRAGQRVRGAVLAAPPALHVERRDRRVRSGLRAHDDRGARIRKRPQRRQAGVRTPRRLPRLRQRRRQPGRQSPDVTRGLFAGLFRIDIDADPAKSHAIPAGHTSDLSPFTRQGYAIPDDNPFVGALPNGLEEFYALGFRNPFSWAFDRQTGDLWLGDVGESFREEVNHVVKGGNYQWPIKEGELANPSTSVTGYVIGTPTPPVFHDAHAEIADLSSIFDGAMYRGSSLPELDGQYLYTDWISNRLWALDLSLSQITRTVLIDHQFKSQPMGVGQDEDGELTSSSTAATRGEPDSGGHVKRLARDPNGAALPRRLRETFLFTDVPSLTPAPDLVPYDVSSPLWSDGASKKRWIRLPKGQMVTVSPDGELRFPVGTIFVKQFARPEDLEVAGRSAPPRDPGDGRRQRHHLRLHVSLERRRHRRDAGPGRRRRDAHRRQDWRDARLALPELRRVLELSPQRRGRCRGQQAQRTLPDPGLHGGAAGARSARAAREARGLLDAADLERLPAPLARPSDTTRPLAERALSYLAANGSPCHHENASYTGGGETWIASLGAGDQAARHLDQGARNYPMTVRLGLGGAKLITPGNPSRSILLALIASNDPDLRMPPLARNVVDTAGAQLIEQWISAMAP